MNLHMYAKTVLRWRLLELSSIAFTLNIEAGVDKGNYGQLVKIPEAVSHGIVFTHETNRDDCELGTLPASARVFQKARPASMIELLCFLASSADFSASSAILSISCADFRAGGASEIFACCCLRSSRRIIFAVNQWVSITKLECLTPCLMRACCSAK